MTQAAIVAEKSALRAAMRARRDQLPAIERTQAAETIAQLGEAFLARHAPRALVAGFMPIGQELSPLPLMLRAHQQGSQLALPRMAGKTAPLEFRAYTPGDPLATTVWGIREPTADLALVVPDVVLTALLAFDARGFRLGYGGGYYDRTIRALRAVKPAALIIGIAYDMQRVDAVPTSDYDERADWILTPSGMYQAAI